MTLNVNDNLNNTSSIANSQQTLYETDLNDRPTFGLSLSLVTGVFYTISIYHKHNYVSNKNKLIFYHITIIVYLLSSIQAFIKPSFLNKNIIIQMAYFFLVDLICNEQQHLHRYNQEYSMTQIQILAWQFQFQSTIMLSYAKRCSNIRLEESNSNSKKQVTFLIGMIGGFAVQLNARGITRNFWQFQNSKTRSLMDEQQEQIVYFMMGIYTLIYQVVGHKGLNEKISRLEKEYGFILTFVQVCCDIVQLKQQN